MCVYRMAKEKEEPKIIRDNRYSKISIEKLLLSGMWVICVNCWLNPGKCFKDGLRRVNRHSDLTNVCWAPTMHQFPYLTFYLQYLT